MGKGESYLHVEQILRKNLSMDSKVLELACGGAVYRPLFEHYVGTDLLSTPYGSVGDIDVYADATMLPFVEKSFDIVFIQAALYLIPNPFRVCREALRVLKTGGRFLVFDYPRHVQLKGLRSNMRQGNYDQVRAGWGYKELKNIMENAGFSRIGLRATKSSSLAEQIIALAPDMLYPYLDSFATWLCVEGVRK